VAAAWACVRHVLLVVASMRSSRHMTRGTDFPRVWTSWRVKPVLEFCCMTMYTNPIVLAVFIYLIWVSIGTLLQLVVYLCARVSSPAVCQLTCSSSSSSDQHDRRKASPDTPGAEEASPCPLVRYPAKLPSHPERHDSHPQSLDFHSHPGP
jgi:hypothetical protein